MESFVFKRAIFQVAICVTWDGGGTRNMASEDDQSDHEKESFGDADPNTSTLNWAWK